MRTEQFDYVLPSELIAQTPLPRGESRLLVLHRTDGRIEHRRFIDFADYLSAEDALVLNDTRVSARRLEALRENDLPAEVLLIRPVGETQWEALVQPGRSLRPGKTLTLLGPPPDRPRLLVQVVAVTPEGGRLLELPDRSIRDRIASWGVAPLPPYIRQALPFDQEERYQTVYARHDGSAAAPTAGLHLTDTMLSTLRGRGVQTIPVTLHVGIDTFRPVRTEDVEAHEMHGEWVEVSPASAERINATSGRIVAVGTTSVRVLETAASQGIDFSCGFHPRVAPYHGETRLFITPGYTFHAVDAMITNFHLPRSTLLMLISAFAGRDAVMAAYAEAVALRYRFFSFGDAMLIV